MSYLEQFIDHVRHRRSKNTARLYELAVRKFLEFCRVNDYNYLDPPPNIIDLHIDDMVNRGLTPASIKAFISGARSFIDYLQTAGVIVKPISKGSPPSLRQPIPFILAENTLKTYQEVLRYVPEPYSTALRLMPLCGLRVEEMCKLKWRTDIEKIDDGILLVVHGGKGNKDRKSPLLKSGITILSNYLKGFRNLLMGSEWLFPVPSNHKDHIKPPMMRRALRKIRSKLGLLYLTPHTLRRTYLTILYNFGVDDLRLLEIAGHTNIATTKRYIRISDGKLTDSVRGINL